MGSKNRIAKNIVPIIQNYIDQNKIQYYIEPFVGGANIIDKIKCYSKFGSDNHRYLIELLKNVDKLDQLPDFITKDHYDQVRTSYRNQNGLFEDWYIGAIGFLSSYNGRFFDGGYAGEIVTKTGIKRNYYKESLSNLKKQACNLQDIKFSYFDFRKIQNINNCCIYCDPPYRGTKQYSTSKNFPYDKFYDWCRELSKKNIVIISEYFMPNDFKCIWSKQTKTSMDNNRIANSKQNNRIEKLFILNKQNDIK